MIPRTYPSVLTDDGQTVMRVHVLQSIAGLTEWVDYIPVQFLLTDAAGNTSDTAGSMFIENTGDPETMQSWVDYIPVWIDTEGTTPYTTNNDGYIPVYDYTGLLNLFAQGQEGVWYEVNDPNLGWRRNQLTWTEQFDNAAWSKVRATVTANAAVSPDGTSTADKLIEDATAANTHFTYNTPSLSAVEHTVTFYAKAAERTWCYLMVDNASAVAYFDLSNGVVGSVSGGITSSITPVGNGWYRCSATQTTVSGVRYPGIGIATADSTKTYDGDGSSGIYLWGAQLETGSTASSYQRITDGNTADFTALTGTIPTLYQDSTGITPCSTPGQGVAMPVGLMLDKHKGLVLGDELVSNGDFSDGTTGWTSSPIGTGTFTVVDGQAVLQFDTSSNRGRITQQETTITGRSYRVNFTVVSGLANLNIGTSSAGFDTFFVNALSQGSYSYIIASGAAFWLTFVPNTASPSDVVLDNISVREVPGNHAYQSTSASRPALSGRYNLYINTDTLSTQNVTTVATSYTLTFTGDGTITLSGTATGAYTEGSHTITCTAGTLTSTVSGTVTNADLRVANDSLNIPSYQRVVDALTYDTTGFPLYLECDGVDDGMVTNSIDFSASDKMFVAAGVRKLSDAAIGEIVSLSSTPTSSNGAFGVYTPDNPGTSFKYVFYSRGTVITSAASASIAAPDSRVFSCTADISGDSAILRLNGVQVASSTSDQGTGNYGNYPLYLFRRGGSSLPFTGRFYNLIVRGGALPSDTQVAQVETYLNRTTQGYEDPGNGAMSLELDFITETYYTRKI